VAGPGAGMAQRIQKGRGSVRNRSGWWLGLLVLGLAAGCENTVPTSADGGLIPVDVTTVEVRFPFDAFATDFQVFGGYGSAQRIPGSFVAHAWEDEVDVNALIRFGALPDRIFVFPPGNTSSTVADLEYVPLDGYVTVWWDSVEVFGTAPYQLEAGAIQSEWDLRTANWEFAVDTVGQRLAWPEPGAGPVRPLDSRSWSLAADGDSTIFAVDSATVAEWIDLDRRDRGMRISGSGDGFRLRVADAALTVRARSSINPDTVVALTSDLRDLTFIHTPIPQVDPGYFRVGGAPSSRATFRLALPESLAEGHPACAVVECPLELRPERLVYAGLVLHSATTVPFGFQPLDTIPLDLRPVLSPDRLPRSPLGASVQPVPEFLPPEYFSFGSDAEVEIPMTRYIRDLIRGPAPGGGSPVPSTLSLLTGIEPWSYEYATFWAPGSELEPVLRLILTISDGVTLP